MAENLHETNLHEYVIAQLAACKGEGEWKAIEAATGVSYHTIAKIFQRQIVDPKVSKLQTLANYFRGREQEAAA